MRGGGMGPHCCRTRLGCVPVFALRRGVQRVRQGGPADFRSAPRARTLCVIVGLIIGQALAGCSVGPDYARAPAPVPTTYKELKGWKVAHPSDTVERGRWWAVYKDQRLDERGPQT